MNAQEVYDTVLQHLRKQGKAAMDGVTCRYRAPDGSKCAVGCLIPDELYKPAFEGNGVPSLRSDAPELYDTLEQLGVAGPTRMLLWSLQRAHDEALAYRGIEAWEAAMQRIAREHGLHHTPPEVSA